MTAVVEEMPVAVPKEEDPSRVVQQNYVLSSQYESLDSDDLYTKYKVGFRMNKILFCKEKISLETSTST
jgi:hypothetical protein